MAYVSSDYFVKKVTTKLRTSGRLSDAKIKLDDGATIPIHKTILAMGSPFFQKLFTWEPDKVEYNIEKVTSETIGQILDWMYCHKISLTDDNVPEVLKTAHYLDCFEVVGHCSTYLLQRLGPNNAIGFWNFAVINQIKELEDKVMAYLTYHFPSVVKEEEFMELSVENLLQILKKDELNTDEEAVFKALMTWVEYDEDHRAIHLVDLIKCIRFGGLSLSFFEATFGSNHLVHQAIRSNEQFHELFHQIGRYLNRDDVALCPIFTKARSIQDIILAIGGWANRAACNIIESFDYRTNKWIITDLVDPIGPRGYLGAATIGSKIYLVGGTDGHKYLNKGCVIDMATGKSRSIGPMKTQRCYLCLESYNGKLYAVGGFNGQTRLNTMEQYTPEENQWVKIESMKHIRSDAGSAIVGDKLCIVGGFDGHTQLRSVEAYNMKTKKWYNLPKMTFRRSGVSCAAVSNEELYVLGGFDGSSRLSSIEKYSFRTKKWTLLGDMDTPRSNFSTCIYEGKILVCGGFDGDSTTNRTEELFGGKGSKMCVKRSALAVCAVKGQGLTKTVLSKFQHLDRDMRPPPCPCCGSLHDSDTSLEDSDMDFDFSDETDEEFDGEGDEGEVEGDDGALMML